VRWETKWSFDGKLCQEYLYQKNYQNLIIGFQVTVKNVRDAFWDTVHVHHLHNESVLASKA